MSPLIVTETRDALEGRRTTILRELGMTLEEFHGVEATRTLSADEWEAREELNEIAFLLGEK